MLTETNVGNCGNWEKKILVLFFGGGGGVILESNSVGLVGVYLLELGKKYTRKKKVNVKERIQ